MTTSVVFVVVAAVFAGSVAFSVLVTIGRDIVLERARREPCRPPRGHWVLHREMGSTANPFWYACEHCTTLTIRACDGCDAAICDEHTSHHEGPSLAHPHGLDYCADCWEVAP